MASRDLRSWMAQLEAEGELKRIKAKVDWDGEISQIIKKVYLQHGPALLFENIKGHEATRSKRLFTNGLGTIARWNLMLSRWRMFELPFSDFEPENLRTELKPDQLVRIAVVAIKKEFKADIAVARLEFYR